MRASRLKITETRAHRKHCSIFVGHPILLKHATHLLRNPLREDLGNAGRVAPLHQVLRDLVRLPICLLVLRARFVDLATGLVADRIQVLLNCVADGADLARALLGLLLQAVDHGLRALIGLFHQLITCCDQLSDIHLQGDAAMRAI